MKTTASVIVATDSCKIPVHIPAHISEHLLGTPATLFRPYWHSGWFVPPSTFWACHTQCGEISGDAGFFAHNTPQTAVTRRGPGLARHLDPPHRILYLDLGLVAPCLQQLLVYLPCEKLFPFLPAVYPFSLQSLMSSFQPDDTSLWFLVTKLQGGHWIVVFFHEMRKRQWSNTLPSSCVTYSDTGQNPSMNVGSGNEITGSLHWSKFVTKAPRSFLWAYNPIASAFVEICVANRSRRVRALDRNLTPGWPYAEPLVVHLGCGDNNLIGFLVLLTFLP